jgi:hypothetical protein
LQEKEPEDKDAKVVCWHDDKSKEKSENKSCYKTWRNIFLGPEIAEFGMVIKYF